MNPTAELLAAAKKAIPFIEFEGDPAAMLAYEALHDAIDAFEKARREAENGPDHDGEAWEGGFAANH